MRWREAAIVSTLCFSLVSCGVSDAEIPDRSWWIDASVSDSGSPYPSDTGQVLEPPPDSGDDDAGDTRPDSGPSACHQVKPLATAEEFCGSCAESEPTLCCIARGACCGAELVQIPNLDFAACTQALCDVPASAFGPSEVSYDKGAWVPAPSPTERSGFVLNGPFAAHSRIRVGARLRAGTACSGCAELIGFGLAGDPYKRAATPDLSVVVSYELSTVLIAAGPKTLWSHPLELGSHDYELEVDPTGAVILRIDGTMMTAQRVTVPTSPLHAFVFGRSDETVAPYDHAGIEYAHASGADCEVTAPTRDPETLTFEGRAPSTVEFDGTTWLAYESSGKIQIARGGSDGYVSLAPQIGPGNEPFDSRGVGDPEWALGADGSLVLYYTAYGSDGFRSVGRLTLTGELPGDIVERAQALVPDRLKIRDLSMRELYGPSVTRDDLGRTTLVATGLDSQGGSHIVVVRQRATGPELDVASPEVAVSVGKSRERSLYSSLGTADIVFRRGHYQLYFVATRTGGSTSTIELMLSNDLRHWVMAGHVFGDGNEAADPNVWNGANEIALYFSTYRLDATGTSTKLAWQIAHVAQTTMAICDGEECGDNTDCSSASECVCAFGYERSADHVCLPRSSAD